MENKKKYKLIKDKFLNKDFSKLNISQIKTDIAIYSRFSLHSINKKKEKNLFRILNSSKKIKLIMIETRTIYDELFGKGYKIGKNEFITSHYRRFIDPKIIKKDINKSFKIEYFKLDKNAPDVVGFWQGQWKTSSDKKMILKRLTPAQLTQAQQWARGWHEKIQAKKAQTPE